MCINVFWISNNQNIQSWFFLIIWLITASQFCVTDRHTHTDIVVIYSRFFLVASCCSRPCVLMYYEFQIIKVFKVDSFLIIWLTTASKFCVMDRHTDTLPHGHTDILAIYSRCMTMYDYVWLCLTMFDYVWQYMTM